MKLLFKLGVWKASVKSRMAAIERQVFIVNGNKNENAHVVAFPDEDQDLEEEDDDDFQGTFVEGLNVINGPKCNKVLNVITFCPLLHLGPFITFRPSTTFGARYVCIFFCVCHFFYFLQCFISVLYKEGNILKARFDRLR